MCCYLISHFQCVRCFVFVTEETIERKQGKMISKLFAPKQKALPVPSSSSFVRISFQLRQVRWHKDTTPPVNVFLVHDVLGSSSSWANLADSMIRLPLEGKSPSSGVNLFCVELRNHGTSPHVTEKSEGASSAATSEVWNNVQDVVQLAKSMGGSPSGQHIVGLGRLGGNIAMLSALAQPKLFNSLAVVSGGTKNDEAVTNQHLNELQVIQEFDLPSNLKECNTQLAKVVPNEVERYGLMHHITEHMDPLTGKLSLKLRSNFEGIGAGMKAKEHGLLHFPESYTKEHAAHYTKDVAFLGPKSRVLTAHEKSLFPSAQAMGVKGGNFKSKVLSKEDGKLLCDELLDFWKLGAEIQVEGAQ